MKRLTRTWEQVTVGVFYQVATVGVPTLICQREVKLRLGEITVVRTILTVIALVALAALITNRFYAISIERKLKHPGGL